MEHIAGIREYVNRSACDRYTENDVSPCLKCLDNIPSDLTAVEVRSHGGVIMGAQEGEALSMPESGLACGSLMGDYPAERRGDWRDFTGLLADSRSPLTLEGRRETRRDVISHEAKTDKAIRGATF